MSTAKKGATFDLPRRAAGGRGIAGEITVKPEPFRLLLCGEEAAIEDLSRHLDVGNSGFVFARAPLPGHDPCCVQDFAGAVLTADILVMVVDASAGPSDRAVEAMAMARFIGPSRIVLALDRRDQADWDRARFDEKRDAFSALAGWLDFPDAALLPISTVGGDNVSSPRGRPAWYGGPTLVEHLRKAASGPDPSQGPLRFVIEKAFNVDGRLVHAGYVVSGSLQVGASLIVARTGQTVRVERLLFGGEAKTEAAAPQKATVALADEFELKIGDVLAPGDQIPELADQFAAHIVWLGANPLLPGRNHLLQIGLQEVAGSVTALKHRLSPSGHDLAAAKTLKAGDVGMCNFAIEAPAVLDASPLMPSRQGFLVRDPNSAEILAVGRVQFALRRSHNVHYQSLSVSKHVRSRVKHQRPCVLWFTGLSGAGKSTIANRVEALLAARGRHTYLLDGDNVRHGLNKDLGFTNADRVENIRRVGEVAKLFVDAGIIVLCAFISPFRAERAQVRGLLQQDEFLEVFVEAPLDICEKRDPKGLYAKSRAGLLPNFTGIDSPYELPQNPDLIVNTTSADVDALAERVVSLLVERGRLPAFEWEDKK